MTDQERAKVFRDIEAAREKLYTELSQKIRDQIKAAINMDEDTQRGCFVRVPKIEPGCFYILERLRTLDEQIEAYGDKGTLYGIDSDPIAPFGRVCECGSDKVGSPKHSAWCSKGGTRC